MAENITQLLVSYRKGQKDSEAKLYREIEGELKKIARGYMQREKSNHTLQATALVSEAYIKLADTTELEWQNRAHFFAIAAMTMRRILIDHARAKKAEKRGGDITHLTLSSAGVAENLDLLDLDAALKELAELNERQARVVELKFFAGMPVEEIAEVLESSSATVKRDWAFAKAWLFQRLNNA